MSDHTASDEAGSDLSPASSRKPDAIAREIELTRAELADTIDAIADRISPKRAVSRGRQAVRAQVSSVTGRAQNEPPTRVISLDEPASASQDSTAPEPPAETPATAGAVVSNLAAQGTSGVDPRLLAAGAVAGAAVVIVLLRRNRS